MYVTRTLSSLLRNPHSLSEPPPGGPWSGVAVIMDEEYLKENSSHRGSRSSSRVSISSLPFPQNRLIEISELTGDQIVSMNFMVIPVANEPLSSSTYYVVEVAGKYAGQVLPCSSREEGEIPGGCCIPVWGHARPKPFDPDNIYQKVRIIKTIKGRFKVESLAYDGVAPSFMSHWENTSAISKSRIYDLNETDGQGMCESLRTRMPAYYSHSVVVGRWYVPFMFVKELGMEYSDQMWNSMYYKMSLEQRWERVFEAENVGGQLKAVKVDVKVKSEVVMLGGRVGVRGVGKVTCGVVRFDSAQPGVRGIGLSVGIVERMKWEQSRVGWVDVGGRDQRLERVEEHVGGGGWRRFGCYVLVERFGLKRMDGSMALTYDFYHIHQIRTKWEYV